ncbi:hypothetical protein FNV43_RR15940 [Rhamnella rubrinervis]|uniref:Uncharacterized protein n=1 Tax=Rhamnella rubrinervis TaxID=2594499 RepID=A0A8K0E9T3_9ROSA|nr:hypothetical protein FNV43_RR15940 [Rhamnella rubrinervis]
MKAALPNACIQHATTSTAFSNTTSAYCFSTAACQRAHQGCQIVGEARDIKNEGKEIGESKDVENMSGVKGFVADTAIQDKVKATEMGEKVGEMAKEAMDTAWDSAKNTSQKLRDALVAEADENVVDTAEYRTMH